MKREFGISKLVSVEIWWGNFQLEIKELRG